MKLKVFKLYQNAKIPSLATEKSACYDVFAHLTDGSRFVKVWNNSNVEQKYTSYQQREDTPLEITLLPGDRAMIPTGLILEIPEGYSVRTHIRSGLSIKSGLTLTNGEGIIDEDYREELKILVLNNSNKKVSISHLERIAQIELVRKLDYIVEETHEMPPKINSRSGGFGSTGKL